MDFLQNATPFVTSMLHPDYPVVKGRLQITTDWAVTLPGQFNRRIEDDSLVLWRTGITVWTIVWHNDKVETQQQRLEWLQSGASPEAFDAKVETDRHITRYAYRLNERQECHALYGFAIGADGHVQIAVYFDDESDLAIATTIWRSLEETSTG